MRASTFFILLVLVLAIVGIHQARSTATWVPPTPPKVRNQQHRADDDDNPAATSKNRNKHAAEAAPKERPHRPEAAQPAAPKEPLWKADVSGQGTSPQAARQDAVKNASEKLNAHLRARYHDFKYIPTPQFLIDHKMVDDGHDEKMTLSDP